MKTKKEKSSPHVAERRGGGKSFFDNWHVEGTKRTDGLCVYKFRIGLHIVSIERQRLSKTRPTHPYT